MSNEKIARSALFGRVSCELAGSAEQLTAPAIAEMTPAEVAQVAGGIEANASISLRPR